MYVLTRIYINLNCQAFMPARSGNIAQITVLGEIGAGFAIRVALIQQAVILYVILL